MRGSGWAKASSSNGGFNAEFFLEKIDLIISVHPAK
jgi:hypothetical protein